MAQAPASTVNHHAYLAGPVNAHFASSVLVEDFIHNLNLCVMVASPEGAKLKINDSKKERLKN